MGSINIPSMREMAANTRDYVSSPAGKKTITCLFIWVAASIGTHLHEKPKEAYIPTAFSDVGKIIKRLQAQNKPIPPLTEFLAKLNDYLMVVFEISNEALRVNDKPKTQANETDMRLDVTYRVHKQLDEYAKEIPILAQRALTSVEKLARAKKEIYPVHAAFLQIWDHTSYPVTHPEWNRICDEEVDCNEAKTNCRTKEVNCRSVKEDVYDYTHHTYYFNKKASTNAIVMAEAMFARLPDIMMTESLVLSQQTDAENEYAMERSMKLMLKGQKPTPEQALEFRNVWAFGSNYANFSPVASGSYTGLKQTLAQWIKLAPKAHTIEKNTYIESDFTPPHDFVVVETAKEQAGEAREAAAKVVDGIVFAKNNALELKKRCENFVAIALEGKKGDVKKARAEVMGLARDLYTKNFEYGFDVTPYKKWKIPLYGFLTAFGAFCTWSGASYARERLGRRKHREESLHF